MTEDNRTHQDSEEEKQVETIPQFEDVYSTEIPAKKKGLIPSWLKQFWKKHGHGLLFVLTLASTWAVGYETVIGFKSIVDGIPLDDLHSAAFIAWQPEIIFSTLVYVVALLGFLTAHEMGHYLTCRRYGVDATLPYYLPDPFIFGTFGAVIKMKSPIRTKKALFDIGIAGPLAGFVVAVPILFIGMQQSFLMPVTEFASNGNADSFWTLGEPLLLQFMQQFIVPSEGQYVFIMSPLGMVGWFACLVTSINLLPVSQLDGGHIFYSVFGKKHYYISLGIVVLMVGMSVVLDYYGWLVWALLVIILGLKHPRVSDEHSPLDPTRLILAGVALFVFLICFVPVPISV